jgi:hypothetical protein
MVINKEAIQTLQMTAECEEVKKEHLKKHVRRFPMSLTFFNSVSSIPLTEQYFSSERLIAL